MVEVNEALHTECYDTALPADGGGQCAVCIRACSYKEPPAVVLYRDDRAGGGGERDARRGDEPHDRGADARAVHTGGVPR